jgi:SAM-dependent methyltransferase
VTEQWYRTAFGAHYPLLYGHRDEAEAALCLELLPRLAPLALSEARCGGRVLDLGCGDGRHLAQLATSSVSAFGLDLSQPLLDAATERLLEAGSAPLVRADMQALPYRNGVFCSVLSLFTAFGYFGALEDHRAMVNQIARVLAPGGHWFLDYLDADRIKSELAGGEPVVRSREAGPLIATETKILSAEKDRVIKTVDIRPRSGRLDEAAALDITAEGLVYREEVALFSIEELDALTADLGLRRVAEAGSYRGDRLGDGDRWILVYQGGF